MTRPCASRDDAKKNIFFPWHMQVVVTLRLYGYMDTSTIDKEKRDKIIKEILVKIDM